MEPKDNAQYLRLWAADIRKHNGKSVDADRLDAIAAEIERLHSQAKHSKRRWIEVAEAALAGDLKPLRQRIDLATTPPTEDAFREQK